MPTTPEDTSKDSGDMWNESEPEDGDESEEEDDCDIDAAAEEITRRLGEELADLTKVNVPTVGASFNQSVPADIVSIAPSDSKVLTSQKEEAIITTMKAILALLANDPLARSSLGSTSIPHLDNDTILGVLNTVVASGEVSKAIAMPLSNVLVSLAQSTVLFGDLGLSTASSVQLDKGKRKRGEGDETLQGREFRAFKRPCIQESELETHLHEATRAIAHALNSSPTQSLDPALVTSIRFQLHQVFLFAVTSSAAGGRNMHALQEIGGLIQVIGVLSGIQIGQPTGPQPYLQPPGHAWLSHQVVSTPTNIGTAVYPCLVTGCDKIFSRLYSLRSHQRLHAVHRPFRCNTCPASFSRNHDLKRHVRLHDRKAWKCGGCQKIFSRRDAIKRHKNGSRTRGPKGEMCLDAEIVEVELDEEVEESAREERRAKIWSGIAGQRKAPRALASSLYGQKRPEEGELQPSVISAIQTTVLSLHGLLQVHVGNALGHPTGQVVPLDPSAGQATLASVITRAQLQSTPRQVDVPTDAGATASATNSLTSLGVLSQTQHTSLVCAEAKTTPKILSTTSLSIYGLSDEQTKMLEEAIANAAAAAQAEAEAEAALEEEDDHEDEDECEDEDEDEDEDEERSG